MNGGTKSLPPILSVKEAADLLRVDPQVIRRAILRKELPALKAGALWRIRRQDLSAYLRRESK